MTVTGFITAMIIGAIIGALGRLLLPGRQNIGLLLTIGVGILAALIGTLVAGRFSNTPGVDWIELLIQVVLAAIGVALVAGLKGGHRTSV